MVTVGDLNFAPSDFFSSASTRLTSQDASITPGRPTFFVATYLLCLK
jgi:hypothetical protein